MSWPESRGPVACVTSMGMSENDLKGRVRGSADPQRRVVAGRSFDFKRAGARSQTSTPLCCRVGQVGKEPRDVETTKRVASVVQIMAMIKPFRAQAVLAALESIEILGGTVREVMGYGRQKNRLQRYLGSEYNASFLPKVEITVFVNDEDVAATLKAIVSQGRTGRMGDGKILVIPCHPDSVCWEAGQ